MHEPLHVSGCSSGGCGRKKCKFEFVGEERREPRCATHAYEWLSSSNSMPAWVEEVYASGKRTGWRRRAA